jgi:hypothetical protein
MSAISWARPWASWGCLSSVSFCRKSMVTTQPFPLGCRPEVLFGLFQATKIGIVTPALRAAHVSLASSRLSSNNAFDKTQLRYFGKSNEGIEVWLNRRLEDASFIIGIGNLVPHPISGYAGGAKILYPGVAGEETIAGFHVSFGLDPENRYGSTAPARTSGQDDLKSAVCGQVEGDPHDEGQHPQPVEGCRRQTYDGQLKS